MTAPSTSESLLSIESGPVSARIDAQWGMTVESLCFEGQQLLVCDLERKRAGATYGIPILFPTPNRVRDLSYHYDGLLVEAMMHGFVRHRPFVVESATKSSVTGTLVFDGQDPLFPYRGTFALTISATESSLTWDFVIRNQDSRTFSWGLGLHPFFVKDLRTRLAVNVGCVMEAVDNFPTGAVSPVAGTPWDFNAMTDVDVLAIDQVFLTDGPIKATIAGSGPTVTISASDEFGHAVIYTAPQHPFLCVEPQTCSTDAHNLSSAGLGQYAGLQVTEAGSEAHLWVRLDIEAASAHTHTTES